MPYGRSMKRFSSEARHPDLVGSMRWCGASAVLQPAYGGAFGQFASAFISGVGQGDIHFAVEPGVGIYIDDVYNGIMSGRVMPWMISTGSKCCAALRARWRARTRLAARSRSSRSVAGA